MNGRTSLVLGVALVALLGAPPVEGRGKKGERPDARSYWYSEGRRIYVPMPANRNHWKKNNFYTHSVAEISKKAGLPEPTFKEVLSSYTTHREARRMLRLDEMQPADNRWFTGDLLRVLAEAAGLDGGYQQRYEKFREERSKAGSDASKLAAVRANYDQRDVKVFEQQFLFEQELRKVAGSSTVLNLVLKRPDSPDAFDAIVEVQRFAQRFTKGKSYANQNITFLDDGVQIPVPAANIKQVAETRYRLLEKSFKDVAGKKKLRKTRVSKSIKSGYVFEVVGLPASGGLPRMHRIYVFAGNNRADVQTYWVNVILTTTTAKDKELLKIIDKMIGGLVAYKP